MIRRWPRAVRILLLIGLICGFAGCGGSDYGQTLTSMVPASWSQVSTSGSISTGCTDGPSCGHIERSYKFATTPQQAATDLQSQLTKQGCVPKREGNGVSASCGTGLHVSVSFSNDSASVILTKS